MENTEQNAIDVKNKNAKNNINIRQSEKPIESEKPFLFWREIIFIEIVE